MCRKASGVTTQARFVAALWRHNGKQVEHGTPLMGHEDATLQPTNFTMTVGRSLGRTVVRQRLWHK